MSKIKSMFKMSKKAKVKAVVELTHIGKLLSARDKVSDIFSGFISMQEQLKEVNDHLHEVRQHATEERDQLNRALDMLDEELMLNGELEKNLAKFINPGGGNATMQVSVDEPVPTEVKADEASH